MDNEENSMLDDLANAWDALEESDGVQQEPEDTAPTGEYSADGAESDDLESTDPGMVQGAEAEAPDTQEPVETDGQPSLDSPPKGLSPEAREVWGDVPEAVKQAIAKREADFEAGIVKYAENAQRAEQMDQALQPFQQLFAMNGGARQTIEPILQTASILQMGSPMQRAQMVANLINQFSVDVKTLDNILVGEAPPPEQQVNTQIQDQVNQALAPYQQFMQQQAQQQAQQQQRVQQDINNEVQQFAAANEFYHDVADQMADLLEGAANRGVQMSMKEAYDAACKIDPRISGILAARAQNVPQKRTAASSIVGSPGGEGGTSAPDSVRGAIEAAFDQAGGRM